MRLVIIDQSLTGVAGHHSEYTLCIARAATKTASVTVLANLRCETPSSDEIDIRRTFQRPWTQPQRVRPPGGYDPTVSFPAWSFLADLRLGLRGIDLSPGDHVFVHSIGFTEVEDILTFAMTCERSRLPVFDILLRRDPEEISHDPRAFKRFVAYVKAFKGLGFWPETARFFTDTQELSERYASATGIPFATLPIPFDQDAMRSALAARPPKTRDEPLTVGYLGDARPEKGFQFLPMVAAKLMHSYLSSGQVRLRVQANFNLPGGETPAMPEARRALERFGPAVELLNDPLDQDEYYRQLAGMDIIVLPYLAERYCRRSSGIFVQAAAAGKVVVVPSGTTMAAEARRYGMENCIAYNRPEELPAAVLHAVEGYRDLAALGTAYQARWCSANSPVALVRTLLHSGIPAGANSTIREKSPLVLHVIDGHCASNRTGAAAVQEGQHRFLRAAGYRIATIYLVRTYPSEADLAALIERNYEYWYETDCVFSWLVYFSQPPQDFSIFFSQTRKEQDGRSLEWDLQTSELLTLPESLRGVIDAGTIDVVWTNYVTTVPFLRLIGILNHAPIICETLDVQSFQYAIHNDRSIDEQELATELSLLALCDKVISLNGSETLVMEGKLGAARITTLVPPLFQEPLSLEDLAGAQNLGELVSSAGSDLPFVDFGQAQVRNEVWQFDALCRASGIDLLFVSSVHPPNMVSFDWFLDSIYGPTLAPMGVTLLLAGSLSATDWALERQRRFANTLFLAGRVDSLRPLYAAAKIVILPITHGAGVSIKTIEAMSLGKPVVATSLALRGLARTEELTQTFDDAESFAGRIVELLGDVSLRREAAGRSWEATLGQRDVRGYFDSLEKVFGEILGHRAQAAVDHKDAGDWKFIEWDDNIKLLNHFVRSLIEKLPHVLALTDAVERVLALPGMREALFRILTAMVCQQTAPILKQQDYLRSSLPTQGGSDLETIREVYFRALLPYSHIKASLRLLAGCRSLADVLQASGFVDSDGQSEAALDIDVAVIAQDPQGQSHRVFVESFMEFYENCYVPHLAPHGVTMAVIGDLGIKVRLPGVFQITRITDPAPILAAARVVVAPWSELAELHPAVTMTMLQAITAGKPLVATAPSLWFLDQAERSDFAAASPEECARRVLDLVSTPAARQVAAAKTRDLADRMLGDMPEWHDWKQSDGAAAKKLMMADIRFAEWGAWTRWCGDLIIKIVRRKPLTAEDVAAFDRELNDPCAIGAWQHMVDAVFGRGDAPILQDQLSLTATDRSAIGQIHDLDDFILEVRKSAFSVGNDRAGGGEPLHGRPLVSHILRGYLPNSANGSAIPDPRSLLVKASGKSVEFDLSERLPGFGWYAAETTANGCHRWTGPEPRFTLELFLSQEAYRCKIAMNPGEAKNFDDFSITINDDVQSYNCEPAEDGTIHLSFVIPGRPSESHSPLGLITFRHASVSNPSNWGASDNRFLGFSVTSIAFSPAGSATGEEPIGKGAKIFGQAGGQDLPASGFSEPPAEQPRSAAPQHRVSKPRR
jgi:glycosyltransferase involved in cell wall biosynthesis